MPNPSFFIRIGVQDLDVAKRALASFGSEGEKALQRLDKATKTPSQSMIFLREATRGASDELRSMASNVGPAGDALSALGKGGLAAAAAIGAVTAAIGIGISKTSEALKVYGAMTDQADALGLSFERFQELTYGFGDVGVDADKTTKALTKLNDALGEILIRGDEAPKELIVAFNALGISIEDIQDSGGDMDTMLKRIADGMKALGSTQEQTAAFTAIFGQRMAALIPIFTKGGQGLDDMAQRARDAGAVISNELGAAMDRVADRTEQLNTIIQAQETGFLVPFIEHWNDLREAYVAVLQGINQLTEAFPTLNQFITSQLTIVGTLVEAWGEVKSIWDSFNRDRDFFANRPGAAGALLADRQATQSGAAGDQPAPVDENGNLVIDITRGNAYRPPVRPKDQAEYVSLMEKFNAPISSGRSSTSADNKAEREAQKQQQLHEQALKQLEELRISSLRANDDIDAAITKRKELDIAAWKEQAEKAGLSSEEIASGVAAIEEEAQKSIDKRKEAETKLHTDALKQLEEMRIAALRANGQIEEAITRRKELDVEAWQEQAAAAGLSTSETAEGVKAIEDQANAAKEASSDLAKAFEQAANIVSGVFADVLVDIATGAEVTAKSVAQSFARVFIQQGIQQLISAGTTALTAAIGGAGAASAGGTAAPAGTYGGQYSGATATGTAAYTFHTGGRVGIDQVPTRYVHPAYFENAPRFHEGLMQGEYPAILKHGETVRTPQQEAALRNPVKMEVTVNNHADVEVQTSQDDNGNLQLDIIRMVDGAMTANASRPNSNFSRYLDGRGRVVTR